MSDEGGEITPVDRWIVSERALVREEGTYVERAVSIGTVGCAIVDVRSADELRKGARGEQARRWGEEIVDVGRQPVVPSFVNGHTHLALAPLRGITSLARRKGNVVTDTFFSFESHLTAADVRVFARLGAFESALYGVGQVWDHYYFGEEVAGALLDVGLGGVVAPTLQDLSGPGFQRTDLEIESTRRIAASQEMRAGGVGAAWGPHATDTVSDELLGRVGDLARSEGLVVHLHLAQSAEEHVETRARFAHGIAAGALSLMGEVRALFAHGLFLADAELERLAAAHWVLGYCPYSQLQFGVLSPFFAWLRAGGGWALGTDCVASNDALDVQRELPFAAGEASLVASFSGSRKAFSSSSAQGDVAAVEKHRRRQLEEIGVSDSNRLMDALVGHHLESLGGVPAGIRVGGSANLLVLDADHPSLYPGDDLVRSLTYGSTSGAISFALLGGKVVGRSEGFARELLSSELYRDTLIEARRRRDELFERAKKHAAPQTSRGGSFP